MAATNSLTVSPLLCGDECEVLALLAARPLHTVIMRGFIYDNGLQSPFNRGTFYGCRNGLGQLEGVALIGHATLIEARNDAAVRAFAHVAQSYVLSHMIIGKDDLIELFWRYYSQHGQPPRRACRELLFEKTFADASESTLGDLRSATFEDLDCVMLAQAQMAFAESGVNPMETDPEGFRQRCSRRIKKGRVWVWVQQGRLVFKADVMANTPDVIYVEGVYVAPEDRGKGIGLECFSRLTSYLLRDRESLCLLVNEQNLGAHAFYRRAGYELRSYYDTIFLEQALNPTVMAVN